MTKVGIYGEIYPELSGNPLCSGYISPHIPPLAVIQIEVSLVYTKSGEGEKRKSGESE